MRALAALILGLLSCSHALPVPPLSPRAGYKADRAAPPPPEPRYVAPQPLLWIERAEGDVDRVVLEGRRLELKGHEIVGSGLADVELEGGARQPSWARGASDPAAYVFWRGPAVYVAPSFTGALTQIATLPRDVERASPWASGVALAGAFGVFVVGPGAAPPVRLLVPGAVDVFAASAHAALVLTALGKTIFSSDGGRTFKDITAAVGPASMVGAFGDGLVVRTAGGSERRIGAGGDVELRGAAWSEAETMADRPPDYADRWPVAASETALEAAVHAGLPLDSGTALAASGATYARVDLATGRALWALAIPEKDADCTPFGARGETLLLCATPERALVFDVEGAARLERSFDLTGAPDLDRFVGVDGEALGFLGPCDGASSQVVVDAVSGASPVNHSPGQSSVFCARADREHWVEHRLDRADASDVLAWIPRPGGDATALVALEGTILADADRVSDRGSLRIVRIARGEPPLLLPGYAERSPALLAREFRAAADGTIEAWLSAASGSAAVVALSLDRSGHPHVYPAPADVSSFASAGPFALAGTEDGHLFETLDRGRTWRPAPLPPDKAAGAVTNCSAVGCRVGALVRLGWTSPSAKVILRDDGGAPTEPERRSGPPLPPPPMLPPRPLARLACAAAGEAEGGRFGGALGFGLVRSPGAQQHGHRGRVGSLGMMNAPWASAAGALSGDVDLAWVSPLDLDAVVHRAVIPAARTTVLTTRAGRAKGPVDPHLAWMLTRDGGVAPVATEVRSFCAAPWFDEAGITLPLGDCLPESAAAVEIGDRVFVAAYEEDTLVTSVVALHARGKGAKAPRIGSGLRELARMPVPSRAKARVLGAGSRRGEPVVVALDAGGEAVLASLEPTSGALGPEEVLAPLGALALASDAVCSRASADDARVVLPLEGQVGLAAGALRGVSSTAGPGFAVLRWSRTRVCLEAIEMGVKDERFEVESSGYDVPGTVRKLVGRFDGARGARLVEIGLGFEVRQPLLCRMDGA